MFIHALSAVASLLGMPSLRSMLSIKTHALSAAGFPPSAFAKGASVPFVGGAPLAAAVPQPPIDGFTAVPGVTQYGARLPCADSLRSAWQCVAAGWQLTLCCVHGCSSQTERPRPASLWARKQTLAPGATVACPAPLCLQGRHRRVCATRHSAGAGQHMPEPA